MTKKLERSSVHDEAQSPNAQASITDNAWWAPLWLTRARSGAAVFPCSLPPLRSTDRCKAEDSAEDVLTVFAVGEGAALEQVGGATLPKGAVRLLALDLLGSNL